MKTKDDFKRHLKDSELLKHFSGVKSLEEVAQIAQQQGYPITVEDVAGTTLTDDILASIAGGKGDISINNNNINNSGNGYINIQNPSKTDVSPTTDVTTDLKVPLK